MRFITRDADYAMQALLFMAKVQKKEARKVVTVDEIVKAKALPERFLRRILQKLAKKKILFSSKGKSGGFSFMAEPENIRAIDIIKIFQGNIRLSNCFLKSSICPNIKTCAFRKRLKKIDNIVIKELESVTLKSLL